MLIVHAADIHLDSPLVGLEKYEGCPVDVLRGATRRAFEGLVTTALEERADLVPSPGISTTARGRITRPASSS